MGKATEETTEGSSGSSETNTNIAQKEKSYGFLRSYIGSGDNYADLEVESNLFSEEKTKLKLDAFSKMISIAAYLMAVSVFGLLAIN